MRRFAKGDPGQLADLGWRLTGSADLYGDDGRSAYHSINLITCHDGFTLYDLASYNDKHNEANGEHNRDGADDNHSWNCGVEGETDDEGVIELRNRQERNFLTTLLLSQGVPMILHGDEMGRTQRGNNNVYCQDNELSWIDWTPDDRFGQLLAFSQKILRLRRDHPVFRRRRFFKGAAYQGGQSDVGDIAWFTPAGTLMQQSDWQNGDARAVAVFLNGERILESDKRGQQILDDSFLVIFNAHYEDLEFTLPPKEYGQFWLVLVDTAEDGTWASDSGDTFAQGDVVVASPRSTIVLRRPLEVDAASSLTAAATGDPAVPSAARAARPGATPAAERPAGEPSTTVRKSVPPPRPALRRPEEGSQG
jgi:glycogen operon protein